MIDIISREQFKDYIKKLFVDDSGAWDGPNSVVWIPENDGVMDRAGEQCEYFVCVPCLNLSRRGLKSDYWLWCSENLKGYVRCFISNTDDDEEYWGFTVKEDITWWAIRWSR